MEKGRVIICPFQTGRSCYKGDCELWIESYSNSRGCCSFKRIAQSIEVLEEQVIRKR